MDGLCSRNTCISAAGRGNMLSSPWGWLILDSRSALGLPTLLVSQTGPTPFHDYLPMLMCHHVKLWLQGPAYLRRHHMPETAMYSQGNLCCHGKILHADM